MGYTQVFKTGKRLTSKEWSNLNGCLVAWKFDNDEAKPNLSVVKKSGVDRDSLGLEEVVEFIDLHGDVSFPLNSLLLMGIAKESATIRWRLTHGK